MTKRRKAHPEWLVVCEPQTFMILTSIIHRDAMEPGNSWVATKAERKRGAVLVTGDDWRELLEQAVWPVFQRVDRPSVGIRVKWTVSYKDARLRMAIHQEMGERIRELTVRRLQELEVPVGKDHWPDYA